MAQVAFIGLGRMGHGMAGRYLDAGFTLAIWNPYVAERLLQGHWSLLLGYGCLPWIATVMLSNTP